MKTLTCALVAATAAGLSVLSPAVASAETSKVLVPMPANYKSCDFIQQDFVAARGVGRATTYLGASGNTVSADVDIFTGEPNTTYDVRVIQTPRPSIGCGPGAPGVITGSLMTDGAGAGRTTVAGPIAAGATGAWVIMTRPSPYAQTAQEFYTSEFVVPI